MKKNYIQPSIKARKVQVTNILAESNPNSVSYGGSNKDKGVNTAESKSVFSFIGEDEDFE